MNHPIAFRVNASQHSAFYLDKAALGRFLGHCTKRHYSARKDISSPGDSADMLYHVISGSLCVVAQEKDGRELVLGYIGAGEFIGELGLFCPTDKRHVTLRTRTSTEIAEIEYGTLLDLMANELAQDCPKILYTMGINLSKRLLAASRKASGLAFVDVTERIYRTVLELCQHPEALTHPQGMQIKASRQELARLSGCSREMAGRALKELQAANKLTAHGKTIVVFNTR